MIEVNATIKKDFKSAKKVLGSFCAQYGNDIPLPPLVRQEKLYKSKRKRANKKYSKFKDLFMVNLNIRNIKNIKAFPLKRMMKKPLNALNVKKWGI